MLEFKDERAAGATVVMEFALTKDEAAWNLTGLPVTFRVNRLSNDDAIVKTRTDGIVVTDATGEIEVTLTPEDTETITKTEDVLCEIIVVDSGQAIVAGRGRLRLVPLATNEDPDDEEEGS